MAHVLIMPRQGNTVESCVIVAWKLAEGADVAADTPICEVETDKATFEVPAGSAGKVLKLLRAAGDDVPVLEAIAVIGAAGEDWQSALSGTAAPPLSPENAPAATSAPAVSAMAATPAPQVIPGTADDRKFVSPRARILAAREALATTTLAGSGPDGRIIERDVRSALDARPALTAAAKTALGAGLGTVDGLTAGSGLGGRATAADLASGPAAGPATAPAPRTPAFADGRTETAIKGIRKLIADRMFQSLATTAQFTLNSSADARRLQDLRGRLKNSDESLALTKVSVNDLVLFAVSRVLPLFPFMNAHKQGTTLITYERVHLGLAVDTPRGLMVPVIRNADQLSLSQLSADAKRLAAACLNGTVRPDELSGSTFSVTNLGALGIESFTPVLNVPEVAILGVNAIELKPVRNADGDVDFAPHIGLSLTIDHTAVDGAPAARFLAALRGAIADIDLWLAK